MDCVHLDQRIIQRLVMDCYSIEILDPDLDWGRGSTLKRHCGRKFHRRISQQHWRQSRRRSEETPLVDQWSCLDRGTSLVHPVSIGGVRGRWRNRKAVVLVKEVAEVLVGGKGYERV